MNYQATIFCALISLAIYGCGSEKVTDAHHMEFQTEQMYTSVAPAYLESTLGGICRFGGSKATVLITYTNTGKGYAVGTIVTNEPELGPFVTDAGHPVRRVRSCEVNEFVLLNSSYGFLSTDTQQE